MGKELKKTDEAKDLIAENKNQEVNNNKKDAHPLQMLKSKITKLVSKHFSSKDNLMKAQTTIKEILGNTSKDDAKHIFNMIENGLANYNLNSKDDIQSDINHDTR